jgi:DNA invertase Pin-like site-specific DNA recombinase
MSKHHAIYMRVSTKRQDTASQEPELRRWAESHEGDSCWFHDTYTGTSMDRPGFRRMIKDMEMGRVDTLVVWRLDRLGRTAKGLTSLFDDLVRWKVNLISLKDGLDLVTPSGRLMANILAGVAAYETEVRAERILAGQTAARMRGVRWGGSARGRRIKVTVEQIASIRRQRSEGREVAAIARGTGLSRPTVYRILGERCNASTGSSDSNPVGKMDCGGRSESSVN